MAAITAFPDRYNFLRVVGSAPAAYFRPMTMPTKTGVAALTEKEKQTLRLIVRGHDAKSVAREFGLSVHTINERLRDARRKLAVSSSREAARLLLDEEGGRTSPSRTPEKLGDMPMGEDQPHRTADESPAPVIGARRGTAALGSSSERHS
ncbi:response regulator transcription factor [Sphingomonas zeae]